MTTLNLKKIHKGIYTLAVEHETIEIDLSNPYSSNGFGTNEWQLIITVKEEIVYNFWFKTKKLASISGANWILKNLNQC